MPSLPSGLLRRSEAQGGAFTHEDLLACGHDDHQLATWRRAGLVSVVSRGAYVLPPRIADPVGRGRELERRRIRATLLVLPDKYVASHRSALAVRGIAVLQRPTDDEPVHLMVRGTWQRGRRRGVVVHHPVPGAQVRGRVIAPADAVVQHAAVSGLDAGVVSADAALHDGHCTRDQLGSAVERMQGRHGAAVLRGLLARVDGRSESPGESLLRVICQDARLSVTPQVEIHDTDGWTARVDLLVDGTNVVLELDGMVKYRDDPQALLREKRREHRLHLLGYRVVRVTWADLADPAALVARIRRQLPSGQGQQMHRGAHISAPRGNKCP